MTDPLLRSLPRRASRPRTEPPEPPPLPGRASWPHATVSDVLVRSALWTAVAARTGFRLLQDKMAGKLDERQVGVRLRQALETLGATAVKLGQQLSIRLDVLPRAVCEELAGLTDSAAPFTLAEARPAMIAAMGGPPEEVLAEIEPEPIGSASIACVWRGRLKSGERVAIKVQRPGIDVRFAADLSAFAWVSHAVEATSAVRPGFFKNLRTELRSMFLSELDFRAEARHQRLYRAYARQWKLKWVSAPFVYQEMSDRRVLVTEFIEGMSGAELIRRATSADPADKARFRELDIDPKRVAERLLHLSYWGTWDAPFFHADPHPGNLIIQSGSRVVMLDFGAVGSMDGRASRATPRTIAALAAQDADAATDHTLVQIAPFPHFDFDAFRGAARAAFAHQVLVSHDPKSPWFERTSASLWLAFLEAVQRFQVPVNLDTLQSMRCSLLYDSIAFRLDPDVDFDTFVRYQTRSAPKRMERLRASEPPPRDPATLLLLLGQSLQPMEQQLRDLTTAPAIQTVEHIEKAYHAIAVASRTAAISAVTLITFAIASGPLVATSGVSGLTSQLRAALQTPALLAVLATIMALGARQVLFRLRMADRKG